MAYKPLFSKNIIEEEEKEKTKSAKYKPLFAGEKSIQTETIDTTPATTPTMTEAPKKVELFKPIKDGSTAYSVDGKIYFPEAISKATDVISQGTFKPTEQTVAERQKEHFELATQKYIDEGKIKNITLSKPVKDFMLGVSGTAEGMIGAAEWISPETMKPFFKEKADQVSSWQKTMTPEDMTFVDKLIAGAGSAATFFIPGLGVAKATTLLTKVSPKLALLFGNSVSTLLESSTEAGSVYRQNLASGMNESEAGKEATKTLIANAVLIGLTNKFGIFSDRAESAIKKILLSAPIEGFQEFWQEVIQNITTKGDDPFEGALESGIIGTILGGGMSATGTFTGILPTEKSSKKDIEKAIKEIEQKASIIAQEEVSTEKPTITQPTAETALKEQTPADKLISEIKQPAETPATKLSKQIKGEVVEKEVVEKADETTQSIQKAKEEGKSFDEWVKGQGERLYHGSPKADLIRKEGFKLLPVNERRMASAYGDGIYFTTKKSGAYADTPDKLIEAYVPKKLKLFDAYDKDAGMLSTKELVAEGYDGVRVHLPSGENHLTIFDPSKIKIRSQLKAEWDAIPSKTMTTQEQVQETIEKYDTDRVGERGAESKQGVRKARKQTGVSKISKESRTDKVTKKKIKVIDPISAVSKLIVKKPSLPVFQEFKAKDGKIYSTDLEVAIKLDYNLPDGMYRIVGKDTIKTDTDPSEYPILPGIDKNVIAQTSTPILNNALKDAVNFVSKNEVKIELTGISLQISPGKITVVATDSYHLYKKIIPAKTNITESIILSNPKKISDILSAIGDKSSISYSKETNLLRISGSNGDIFVKTIDGQYPDFNAISDIIPNYKYSYSINRDEMLNAIKDLKPFVHKKTQEISFDFDDQKGKIKLYAENKEINVSKEITIDAKKVDVDIIGKDLQDFNLVMPIRGEEKIVLRHEYLESVVKTIDRENVFMSVFDKDLPVLFNESVIQKKSPSKTKSTREVEGFIPRDINSLENPLVNQMNDKLIKRSDIARGLSEKLNVPIRMGKFRVPKVLGIFKPGQKVVRLKKGGLPVIFHEVGHYLDFNYDFSKDINKKERTALMEEYGFKYEGQTKKQRKEAFAEFLRFRLTGQRNKSDSYAPIFSTIFDKRLESLPDIKEVLDTAENDYMRWIQQPATAKILSHISIGSEDKGSFKERSITKIHDLYTSIKDDMHPIREYSKLYKKFTGKKLNLKDDPYILSRNLKGWVGKANVFLEQGTFGKTYWKQEDGKTVPNFKGKSFQEIIKPVELAGKTNDFRTYLVSQRVIELSKREKPITTGINTRDAYEAVNELETNNPEFKQIANDLYKYQNDLIDYAIESGLIGEESGKKIKEFNKFRVPFYRVMEETQSAYMGSKRKIGGNISSPVRKIKGSEREIIDPLESIVKDTYSIINAVERNNIGIAMGNLANQHYELGRLFEEVDSPMKAVKVNVAEVLEKALETKELDIGDLEIGDLMVNIFRPMQDKGNNMITVNFGDKQKTFQVEPRLFRTLQGLNIEDLGLIVKIASFPAKLLRAGATLTPDFSIRNPLRDQWTAFIYSKYGFVPGYDFARGVFELFKKGDTYKLWRMGGGEHSMMVSLDRDYLQNNFDDIVRTRGGKAFQYVKNPIELLRVLSEVGEKGARLGEMIRASEAGADPIEGAYASRELTLDFARMGSKAKAINAIIAFWNANVEGTDRLARNFKDYPAKTSFKILVSITLPSIILFLLNEDDPRWKEIPQWQKDLFWIVFTKDHIIRIPKPFEIGILFGSVPERILEYMKKNDPEVFDQLKKSVVEGATPGFIPTGLLPIIETISNYSFFLERPIVPRGKEDYPAEAQYGTYTSQTAKELGKIMQFSPSKIDNIIQGYTGGLGRYAVNVIDKVLEGVGKIDKPKEPAKDIEDYQIIKSFMIRDPVGSSSESVNSIYNLYSKAIGERNYFNKLKKDGKIGEAEMFFDKSKNIMFAPILTKVINDFSDINKSKEIIRESDLLSPEEKRESIKELNVLQTEIAKEILKTIKENR